MHVNGYGHLGLMWVAVGAVFKCLPGGHKLPWPSILVLLASAWSLATVGGFGKESLCGEELDDVDEVLAALDRNLDKAKGLTRMGFLPSTTLDRYRQALRVTEEKKQFLEEMMGMGEEEEERTWKRFFRELYLLTYVIVISIGFMLFTCELLPHVFSAMKGPHHTWGFSTDPAPCPAPDCPPPALP